MTAVAQPAAASRPYDAEVVRAAFPIFTSQPGGRPFHYLDTAATAQKPGRVIDRVAHFYGAEYASVHRGAYRVAAQASAMFEGVRRQVAAFLGAPLSHEVIFTSGSTAGINLVAQSWGRSTLRPGDEILVSEMEHHANLVPWQMVAQATGAVVRPIPVTDAGELDMAAYRALVRPRTKLVAITHLSNVLGTINPVAEVAAIAHAAGALVMVDGAQSAAHLRVNVQSLGCDFFVCSAHKLGGPTGLGVLWGREELLEAMPPFMGGGAMIEQVSFEGTTYAGLPAKFEPGTPHIAGVAGLGAAIEFLEELGLERIAAHEDALLAEATDALHAMGGVRILGEAPAKSSVISFAMDCAHPHDIATILDEHGVAIRAGHHCAQPLMRRFKVPATARASFGCYSTRDDVKALVAGVEAVKRIFG